MLKSKIKLYPYHTFLVIPFIVLFLYAHNIDQTRPAMTYRTLWIGLIISGLFYVLFYFLFKSRLKAGIFVTFLLFILFQYGVLYDVLETLYIRGQWPLKNIHRYLIIIYLLILSALFWFTKKTNHDFVRINYFLNFLVILLIGYNLVRISVARSKLSVLSFGKKNDQGLSIKFEENTFKPNIYYIILDGYAAHSVLEKYYDYNNNEFVNYLKRLNFTFCDSAFANYYYTVNSLAATLNMNYLDSKVASHGLLRDNSVFKTFQSNGYRVYHMYSGYAVTANFTSSDSTIYIAGPREFEKSLFKYTILRLDDLVGFFAYQRLNSQFKKMHDIVKLSSHPKFCFLHFVAPHPPYIYNREGKIRTSHRFAEHSWEPKEYYVDQLIYVNKKIKELLAEIIAKDPTATVILQSDHGPWLTSKSKETVFEARSKILYAYRSSPAISIPRTTSSVNTFRYLFGQLFKCELAILPDVRAGKEMIVNDPLFLKKME